MLAELQQQFADQLLASQKPADAAGNGANASDSIALAISGPAPAAQLVQLYRNNFYLSLRERLEAVYPVTLALVGGDCFAQLSNRYVRAYPLGQASLSDYGDRFGDHLAELIATESQLAGVPYLADVARLEWLLERAVQQPLPSGTFDFERLSALEPEQQAAIRLQLAPGIGLLQSDYAAAAIHRGVSRNALEHLDPAHQPEQLLIIPAGESSETEPQIEPLSAADFTLLEGVQQGLSLAKLAQLSSDQGHLTPALLIQRGLVTGFELPEPDSQQQPNKIKTNSQTEPL